MEIKKLLKKLGLNRCEKQIIENMINDLEPLTPPQFEIINGICALNQPAQVCIGQYTHIFYSPKESTIILKPQPNKDDQTFEVLNDELDFSSFLKNQSFQKGTLKKTHDSITMKLKPQKTGTPEENFNLNYPYTLLLPLETTDQPWISVHASGISSPQDSVKAGKWLIFCDNDTINDTWIKIAQATFNNQLGFGSKVSTSMSPSDKKVICVYTYDAEDEDDVMKVRKTLRTLGIKGKIPYKTNLATKKGEYASEGKRISKYYC
jgi:hypothetical protein